MEVLTETHPVFAVVAALVSAVCLGSLWCLWRARRTISELKGDRADLLHMMNGDDLTSARSRRFARTVFAQDPQKGQNALIFIDMDNFKSVNDGYGHKAGDALLRAVSDALLETARPNELVFRIGGDEFGVYIRDTDLAAATRRADVVRRRLADVAIFVDQVRIVRTASVGVARIERGQDFVGALYYADEAQYAAKTSGGNTVRANAGETLRSMIARRTSPRAEDLAKAISRDEVTYHVQPVFDTRNHCAIGVEALLRWQRPDGRLMMPDQFLSAMSGPDQTDLGSPLARAREVADAFTRASDDIFCAFNVSSSFLDTNVDSNERWVDKLLSGLKPERTVFEIVEHAVIRNPATTKALLSHLRAQGARIALDDFGTGLSNLERLQQLEIDIVKIDRRFVRAPNGGGADLGILRALLSMSEEMGFDIIAEGVETQEDLDTLNEIGIWNVQGFYLGRPDSVEHWLKTLGLAPTSAPLIARS